MTENPPDARQCIRCGMYLGGLATYVPGGGMRPASRLSRLLARVVDFPFSIYSIVAAMSLAPRIPGGDVVPTVIIMFAGFTIPFQLWLLATRGQTIGKRLFKLRIVRDDDDKNGGVTTNVLLRTLVAEFLWVIPGYIAVDNLFIFARNRRCVHDYIASTKVIRDQLSVAPDWRALLRDLPDRIKELAQPGRYQK